MTNRTGMAKFGTYVILGFMAFVWVAALAIYISQFQPPGNLPPDDTSLALIVVGLILLAIAGAHQRSK
jgi:uncharacterized membrane-anchored protein